MKLERIGMHWVVRDSSGKIVSRTLYRPDVAEAVELPMSERIKDAVASLDVSDDSVWTRQGYPQMQAVEEIVGDTAITRRDVDEATDKFRRG